MLFECDGYAFQTLSAYSDTLCSGVASFQCDNAKCVSTHRECDGRDDCGDGSDETGCGQLTHLTSFIRGGKEGGGHIRAVPVKIIWERWTTLYGV